MRARRASVALTFVALAASALLAQQPPRDNRPTVSEGAATLAGRVVTQDADSRPLRKTIVTLRSDDGRIHRTAITDDGGAFLFGGLPAGRYGLDANRRGWPAVAYGARRPHQRGTRIEVAEGQRVDGLLIRMPRGAVLTGSVVDHSGRPLAHCAVVALRFTFINGERRLTRYREDHADDRGIYRLYGLAAGEYLVATAGLPMAFEDLGVIHATGEIDVRRIPDPSIRGRFSQTGRESVGVLPTLGFAPVYYPGTPMRAHAMMVTVVEGEERSALDFEVAPAQALALEGMVDKPRGFPGPASVRLTLRAIGDDAGGFVGDERQTVANSFGSFVFGSVPPGTYELTATLAHDEAIAFWASSAVTVSGDHAPRMLLSMRPALTLSGRVVFDGQAATELSRTRVSLQRLPQGETHSAAIEPSGGFVINGLVPGRYRLVASAAGSREAGGRAWSARSFVVNGAEMLEAPLELRSSLSGAVVAFTDRNAWLSGTVLDGAGRGAPEFFVVVFPADPRLWGPFSRRIHAVRPSSEGRYFVEGLAPGEYLVAVQADVEEGEWFDRGLLQRLASSALRVEVSEGQGSVKDFRVQ